MAYCKDVVDQAGKAVGIRGGIPQASGDTGKNGSAPGLRGLPIIAWQVGAVPSAITIHGIRPDGIVFQAIRGVNGRPEIQERIHVDLIEVNPVAAANHKTVAGVIGKAEARGEIVIIRLVNRVESRSLHHQAWADFKNTQIIPLIAVQRTEVLPTQSIIDIQLGGDLPVVLSEEIPSIHDHFPLRVSNGDGGFADVAG